MEGENKYRKLSEDAKEYLKMRYDLLRLELLEKLSLIVSLVLLIVISVVFLLSAFMYASLALVFYLRNIWGSPVPGFLLLCGVFLAIAALLFVMKEKWFVNPLIKQLSAILFKDESTEEEVKK
jgi:hypothetical protein